MAEQNENQDRQKLEQLRKMQEAAGELSDEILRDSMQRVIPPSLERLHIKSDQQPNGEILTPELKKTLETQSPIDDLNRTLRSGTESISPEEKKERAAEIIGKLNAAIDGKSNDSPAKLVSSLEELDDLQE